MELLAFITGVISVYLAGNKNIHTWITGVVSCSLLFFIFYTNQMPFMAWLQVIMIVFSLFGLFNWSAPNKIPDKYIKYLSIICVLTTFLPLSVGEVISFDYVSFAWALSGTLLLSIKNKQCWPVFITSNGFTITSILIVGGSYIVVAQYIVFIILSIKGYLSWQEQ